MNYYDKFILREKIWAPHIAIRGPFHAEESQLYTADRGLFQEVSIRRVPGKAPETRQPETLRNGIHGKPFAAFPPVPVIRAEVRFPQPAEERDLIKKRPEPINDLSSGSAYGKASSEDIGPDSHTYQLQVSAVY
ncbi:MAG: hypothetical protein II969_11040 [Anaerolineaceae bacterium]|nr:hypothetical protein [Anaerolineaceae bacterium]